LVTTSCATRPSVNAGQSPSAARAAPPPPAAAIGDLVTPFDMRGDPASVLRAADELRRRTPASGDSPHLLDAQLVEARAAAAGGDWARALRIGHAIANAEGLPPGSRAFLEVAVPIWERFRLGESDESSNLADEDIAPEAAACGALAGHAPRYGDDAADADTLRLLYAVADRALKSPVAVGMAGDPRSRPLIEAGSRSLESSACAQVHPCFWGELLSGTLLASNGAWDQATERFRAAGDMASRAHDNHLAAQAALAEGDLLAAPFGSPLDLGLDGMHLAKVDVSTNAGKPMPFFESVDPRRLEQAAARYAEARRLFEQSGSPRGVAHTIARTAFLSFARGDMQAAADGYRLAEEAFRERADVVGARRSRIARTAVLVGAGDYTQARAQAAEIAADLKGDGSSGLAVATVRFWTLAAHWWFIVKREPRARIEALAMAKELSLQMGLHHAAAATGQTLADAYAEVGRRREALLELEASEREIESCRDRLGHLSETDSWRRVSILAAELGQLTVLKDKRAIAAATRLQQAATDIGNPAVRAVLEENVRAARVALDPKAPTKEGGGLISATAALVHRDYAQVRALVRPMIAGHLRALEALTADASPLALQARREELEEDITLLVSAKDAATAGNAWQRVERIRPQWLFHDPAHTWVGDVWQAQILAQSSAPADALPVFERAIAAIEREGVASGTSRQRAGFYEDAQWAYRAYTSVLLRLGRSADALAVFEQSRARTFQDELRVASTFVGNEHHESTFRIWSEEHAELETVQRRLFDAAPADRAALERRRAELKERLESLDAAIAGQVGDVAAPAGPVEGATLVRTAVSALDPEGPPTALLAYAVFPEDVWLWVIDRTGLRGARKVPLDAPSIVSLVSEFTERVAYGDPQQRVSGEALYRALLLPAKDLLPKPAAEGAPTPRIGVIPSGVLARLPFQALPAPEGPLVTSYDLFYAPALRVYAAAVEGGLRRERPKPLVVQTFGNDALPGSIAEAQGVARGLPALLGPAMTTAAFGQAATHPGILHLATHGSADDRNPFYGTLDFSDRSLRTYEILGLSPKAWMVTLTACDTNVPQLTATDEPTTIGDAFLLAGVPTVVASAWRVVDGSVTDLIARFYEGVSAGLPPAHALSAAQRERARAGVPSKYWGSLAVRGMDR
jgi:CHAT domain-containing protein